MRKSVLTLLALLMAPLAIAQTGQLFYPITPCRLVDTRQANGPLGGPSLVSGQQRAFPLMSSSCGIASNATAYSLNLTVVPNASGQGLNYLTIWPTGVTQPVVSTLNDLEAVTIANAAIVPAGMNGQVSVYVTNPIDLIIDINGYFAPGQTTTASFSVDLTWQAPADQTDPVVGYNIYRANGLTFQQLNVSELVNTAFVDTTVIDGEDYQYYATSLDANGRESVPSNIFNIAVP